MGIPGLLKEIGKGERIALSKLAVDFLESHRRPIRVAIDIAIWQFQSQAGQGGQNPALRTFYYRLLRILALPIHPLFVYDGPKKPLAKRNKVVSRYGTTGPHDEMSKKLLRLFRFPYRTAPGEAEAECALLQREGIVDAVMSQDVDAIMWGSTMTLRDWSQEGTRGNKTATHVNVLRAEETKEKTGLDPAGMILVAILSGGDYSPDGIPGFGPGLACEIAKAQFGSELLDVASRGDKPGLADWKERLQYELETNESGYFKTRHKSVKIPEGFPDETLLRYYTNPAVSPPSELPGLRAELSGSWDGDIDTSELRQHVAETFNWRYRGGACKFIRSLAPALLACRLLRQQETTTISSSNAITERRMHFVSDGMPELRLTTVPADIVGLNIEDEEDNPEYVQAMEEDTAAAEEDAEAADPEDAQPEPAAHTSRPRKKAPWDPRNPEKTWIPESIVKLGLPELVEDWEQRQRDVQADAKNLIAKKARKINSAATATHATRSIHTYFGTGKPGVTARSLKPSSPTKIPNPAGLPPDDRDIRGASTPTRRKARATVTEPYPSMPASTNPFSIASSTRTATLQAAPTLPSMCIIPQKKPNPRKPRQPMQKSKTLPASFEPTTTSTITISSSPVADQSPRRGHTPPPTLPLSHSQPPPTETAMKVDSDLDESANLSSDDSFPSPSQLFQPRQTSLLPTSTAHHAMPGGGKQTIGVVPRDSLPGTWREALGFNDQEEREGGGEEERMREKKKVLPRVSVVDLTDL